MILSEHRAPSINATSASSRSGPVSSSRSRLPAIVKVGCGGGRRSEEHTSELQSLMRNSYAVFCLKQKKKKYNHYLFIHYNTCFRRPHKRNRIRLILIMHKPQIAKPEVEVLLMISLYEHLILNHSMHNYSNSVIKYYISYTS